MAESRLTPPSTVLRAREELHCGWSFTKTRILGGIRQNFGRVAPHPALRGFGEGAGQEALPDMSLRRAKNTGMSYLLYDHQHCVLFGLGLSEIPLPSELLDAGGETTRF